jgi:hypothetical protein
MKGRVRLLRRAGARVPDPPEWREGYVETETVMVDGRPVRRLALRVFQSAPGMGQINVLYRPEVVRIDDTTMVLRGIERVQLADGERWSHPFEHESGDDKWNSAGLTAVQRCPRRRAGVACDERTTDAVGISY